MAILYKGTEQIDLGGQGQQLVDYYKKQGYSDTPSQIATLPAGDSSGSKMPITSGTQLTWNQQTQKYDSTPIDVNNNQTSYTNLNLTPTDETTPFISSLSDLNKRIMDEYNKQNQAYESEAASNKALQQKILDTLGNQKSQSQILQEQSQLQGLDEKRKS